jgi:hypothetical protein
MKKETLEEIKKIYLDDGSFGNPFDDEITDKKLDNIKPLLGEIIVYFNYLEDLLDDTVTEFIFERSSDLGLTIIAKMGYAQKVELFRDLVMPACKHTNQSEFALRMSTLIQKLKDAGESRNRAIHAKWIDANKDFFVRTKTGVDKNGVYGNFIKLDRKTLKKYLKNIQDLLDEFDEGIYSEFITGMK